MIDNRMLETTALRERLASQAAALTQQLDSASDVLERFPLQHYIQFCEDHDSTHYACELPKSQVNYLRRVDQAYDGETACVYNQATLLQLSLKLLGTTRLLQLPSELLQLTLQWIERVHQDTSKQETAYYDALTPDGRQLDNLKRDFAVCTGRALPVGGAWIVERRRLVDEKLFTDTGPSAMPGQATMPGRYARLKRLAEQYGARDFLIVLRNRWYVLTGHYNNYLVIHTADRYRRLFSEKHLHKAYLNIALLLQSEADLVGLYRSSWFLDPKVIEMEPKLAFLSATPVNNGARYGPCKPITGKDIDAVLNRSRVRAAAYERGEYQPWAWAYLWRRADLLAWAERETRLES